jgi:hypothetical protein
MGSRPRVLVIACGALAREIAALRRADGWPHLDVQCLPADLHNHPRRIPGPGVRIDGTFDIPPYGICFCPGQYHHQLEFSRSCAPPGAAVDIPKMSYILIIEKIHT